MIKKKILAVLGALALCSCTATQVNAESNEEILWKTDASQIMVIVYANYCEYYKQLDLTYKEDLKSKTLELKYTNNLNKEMYERYVGCAYVITYKGAYA